MLAGLAAAALAEPRPANPYDVLVRALQFPERIESLTAYLADVLGALSGQGGEATDPSGGQPRSAVLQRPATLRSAAVPWLASPAIADYREALRKDFVRTVGKPDGYMSAGQLAGLAAQGRLPGRVGAEAWLAAHDRDGDGRLTIEEFLPSAEEIARTVDLVALTNSFVHGIPYPTGQVPLRSGAAFGLATTGVRLFATPAEIEGRIRGYASRIGGTTYRDANGRLAVRDANGQPVFPLPPDIVPPTKEQAEEALRRFVQQIGGTAEFAPDRGPLVRGPDGREIPLAQWPPYTQPPYHPPQ
jgi:hypothetical protein